jgi:trigger factor
MEKPYQHIIIKELENSEVEITGEIVVEALPVYRKRAIKLLNGRIEIPGFRKGNIPEHVLVSRVGEMSILEETAELAMRDAYPKIIAEYKIDAIGKPSVTLTKLAPANPIGFTIKTAVMPAVELSDYKKIAQSVLAHRETVTVEEKEIQNALFQIRKSLARAARQQTKVDADRNANTDVDENPPELTDEDVRKIGDFKDVADFTHQLTERLKHEKELRAIEKKRIEIGEKIIQNSTIVLPNILIEGELDKMFAQLKGNVARAGIKLEDYLSHIKKTEEELRSEWRTDAIKRAKLQLALNKIASEEHITVPDEEIEKNTSYVLKHNKDADRESVRIYVETTLMNEKVFEFLEKQ